MNIKMVAEPGRDSTTIGRNYKRHPGEIAGLFVMCLIYTLLYSFTSGAFLFLMTLKYTHDPSMALDFGMWIALLVLCFAWPAFHIMTQKPSPLAGWQTAPINSYRFETKTNNDRTIQRTTLEMSAQDMYELRRIAELVVEDGETFNARLIGSRYAYWRKRLMTEGWIAWADHEHRRGGVVVTEKGYNEMRNVLNPPTPDGSTVGFTGNTANTHTTEA